MLRVRHEKTSRPGLVEQVVLGDDDALAFADRVLAHHGHAAAQQLAGGRVAHPAQGVDAHPLGLRPGGAGLGLQRPDGEDHGVGRAASRPASRGERRAEGVQRLVVHDRGPAFTTWPISMSSKEAGMDGRLSANAGLRPDHEGLAIVESAWRGHVS
jgi:hypothetical protein